jgi:hypothetical protein
MNSNTFTWYSFNNFAANPATVSAPTLTRSTADFLLRVATKRQYVRAIQALRRR